MLAFSKGAQHMRRKMIRVICSALSVMAMVLAFGKVSAESFTSEIQLLETGEFHGDEVVAQTGEQWLGLFPNQSGFELLTSVITVEAVYDPIVDGDDSSLLTGKKVSVNHHDDPVFLLKGADMLQPGSAVTILSEKKYFHNGVKANLQIERNEYQLEVVSDDPEPVGYLKDNSKLLLTFGRFKQVLFSLDTQNDASWTLLWAGDIDRDGKLDLYMDLSDHYNVSQRRLFLSSQAKAGELVKEVAAFVTVGC
jgi:hypothetical protein